MLILHFSHCFHLLHFSSHAYSVTSLLSHVLDFYLSLSVFSYITFSFILSISLSCPWLSSLVLCLSVPIIICGFFFFFNLSAFLTVSPLRADLLQVQRCVFVCLCSWGNDNFEKERVQELRVCIRRENRKSKVGRRIKETYQNKGQNKGNYSSHFFALRKHSLI